MKKSALRHILTALGTVLALFGMDNFVDLFSYVDQNLETIWAAVETIIGFALTIYGFVKNSDRHIVEEEVI